MPEKRRHKRAAPHPLSTPPSLECQVGQTSVRQGCESESEGERVRSVFERERRVLAEKARLLVEGVIVEHYTVQHCIRVRPTVKQLYQALPPQVKKAAKHAFEAVVLSYWLGGSAKAAGDGQPVIVNMNIVEQKQSVNVDLKPLAKLLERLEEELRLIANLARFPSQTNVRAIVEKASELLKLVEKSRSSLNVN